MARYINKWNNGTLLDQRTKDKIKAIQKGLGTYEDGFIGDQTIDVLYRQFANVQYPYSDKFFNAILIFGKPDKLELLQDSKLTNKEYCMSGTFSWNRKPISIYINDGVIINDTACHKEEGFSETIMYYDGKIKLKRARTAQELPDCKWAIGGCSLVDAKLDGFTRINASVDYSDVLRKTSHTILAYTTTEIVGIYYCGNYSQIQDLVFNKLKLKGGILLDGGHIAAINGIEKKNLTQWQQSYIKFGG